MSINGGASEGDPEGDELSDSPNSPSNYGKDLAVKFPLPVNISLALTVFAVVRPSIPFATLRPTLSEGCLHLLRLLDERRLPMMDFHPATWTLMFRSVLALALSSTTITI